MAEPRLKRPRIDAVTRQLKTCNLLRQGFLLKRLESQPGVPEAGLTFLQPLNLPAKRWYGRRRGAPATECN